MKKSIYIHMYTHKYICTHFHTNKPTYIYILHNVKGVVVVGVVVRRGCLACS
jgi:hypothetical protein